MAQETIPVQGLGTSAAPLTYNVAVGDEFDLMAAFASFDGTGAGSSWVPALQVLAPSGAVMVSTIGATVAAGGSADVTFAPFLENDASATSSGGGVPSVATFHRTGGAHILTVPAGATVNLSWPQVSLPSDGSITGPFTGNVFVQFNTACMTLEGLYTQWDDPGVGYLKAAVIGTDSRIQESDQFSLGTAGAAAFDGVGQAYGDSTSYVRHNAHIANDTVHAYVKNGGAVAHDLLSAYLVFFLWPAPGYAGGIPGYP